MSKNKVIAWWTDWNNKGALGEYSGIGWYRIINPLTGIKNVIVESSQNTTLGGKEKEALSVAKKLKKKGNIWYTKYIDSVQGVLHVLLAKRAVGAKLVVDLDDDFWNVNEKNYAYKFHYPGGEKNNALRFLIKECDAIVASTRQLADVVKHWNPSKDITVIPNTIDTSIWNNPIKKNDTGTVRIGWISSMNHTQDIPEFVEAIDEVLKKYPQAEFWTIGSWDDVYKALPRVTYVRPTSRYKDYPKFLQGLGLDISIAPIVSDKFNESKSNIKWLEATMAELPTVASNWGPYKDSITNYKTGYLAKNKNEWVKYLSWLVESKEKRDEIAKNAKKELLKNWTKEAHQDKYIKLFERL
jgi:glycosyltransferase involved in cell wall biosynthesis